MSRPRVRTPMMARLVLVPPFSMQQCARPVPCLAYYKVCAVNRLKPALFCSASFLARSPAVREQTKLLRCCRIGAAPCLTSLRACLTPRLTPHCARLTSRQTSLLPAGLRSGSWWGRAGRRAGRLGLSFGYHQHSGRKGQRQRGESQDGKNLSAGKNCWFAFFAHVDKSSATAVRRRR
jgi:hypothetical protein